MINEDEWELFDNITEETVASQEAESAEEEACVREQMKCFMCTSRDIGFMHEDGQLVCNGCGTVLCMLIDKNQEHTSAMTEGSNINIFLPKSSLGTSISGNPRMKIRLVNEWWKWVYKEKAFYDDKKKIEERCYNARLPKCVVDNALNLYKKASESRHEMGENKGKYMIVRGVNRRGLMAACVYYGASMQKQPRTPKEIADIFELKRTYMTRGCKKFQEMIGFNQYTKNETVDFVDRYSIRLGLSVESRDKAKEIVSNITRLNLASSHQPPSIAAAAILLLADLSGGKITVSKHDLHEMFKISEVTITKTYKKIQPLIDIVKDSSVTDQVMGEILAGS